MALLSEAKRRVLDIASEITGRHAVLFPAQARDESRILAAHAPYRLDGSPLVIQLLEPDPGRLTTRLMGYSGHFPTRELWASEAQIYQGPCQLSFAYDVGAVRLANTHWGNVPMPLPGRRFVWRLRLEQDGGRVCWRDTGHYVAIGDRPVDETYYNGDDYIDYEAQSRSEIGRIIDLMQHHRARGPVLEVGCATGGALRALEGAGERAYGLDYSAWAVEVAERRLGPGRVWKCDLEKESFPEQLLTKQPFGSVILWAVLEHFHDPAAVLAKLTALSAPDAALLINTTNAGSLSHQLFGEQWEGHYDWTHHSIDVVSAEWLRRELPPIGWRIERLITNQFWDSSVDPSHATLRDLWSSDSRFRRLLEERDLGDFVTCVARRI